MPANDIYELSVDATYKGEAITNVYHFVQIGADGGGDARAALINVWVNSFMTNLANMSNTLVLWHLYRCRRLLPTQTQPTETVTAQAGAIAGVGLPTNQCSIVRMYGALSGRKGIGNKRITGIDATFVASGRVNASYRGLQDTFALPFKSNQADISGYVFRAAILGTDNVARQVLKTVSLPRVKQLRSRTFGQGD